ncbi:hypothetical protein ACFOWZ_44495 [Lentzea rhizosphaerae]|uniref:Uncharacterized protein n=1 Tax=Lentzea rhizosphaerae TaxID=2041025 RepID=A0ABV8C981_9PSEU
MDKGDVAAWVAVLVAVGAAWIAVHNANSARRQADAAEASLRQAKRQAEAAEQSVKQAEQSVKQAQRSAQAAEQQAQAAHMQVEIMQAQLDDARAERDHREGPQFEIEEAVFCDEEVGGFSVKATVKMISGPPLARVTAKAHGEYLNHTFQSPLEAKRPPIFEKVRPGSKFTAYTLRDDCMAPLDGVLDLTCEEEGGDLRTWSRSLGVQYVVPPESRSARIRWLG